VDIKWFGSRKLKIERDYYCEWIRIDSKFTDREHWFQEVLDNEGSAIKKANKKQVEADIRKVIMQIGKKQGHQQDSSKATGANSGRYRVKICMKKCS
jgi:hypothetical protein